MSAKRAARRRGQLQQSRAKRLRRDMTWPERRLWAALRNRRLGEVGPKFRRQQIVGPFIVDFICAEHRLIVEVDGESHVGRGEQDARRDAFLRESGFRVLRVTNEDVLKNLDAVLAEIHRVTSQSSRM